MAGLIGDSAARLFASHCVRAPMAAVEAGQWPGDLWAAVEASGFLDAAAEIGDMVSHADVFDIARAAGAAAWPVPLVETLIARAVARAWRLDLPEGPAVLAQVDGDAASRVPFGRHLGAVIAVRRAGDACQARVFRPTAWRVRASSNLAGEPRDTLVLADGDGGWIGVDGAIAPDVWGAAMRTAQIAGAAGVVRDMARQHALDRIQFGRPIARFQAVQHLMARLAGQAAAADASSALACAGIVRGEPVLVGAAKSRAGEAAGLAAALSHQVHGAIGLTQEHDLPRWTRRLLAWRDEYGSEHVWNARVGRDLAARGADDLWSALTAL